MNAENRIFHQTARAMIAEAEAEQLAAIVREVLNTLGVGYYAEHVMKGDTNFALIKSPYARALSTKMSDRAFTVSHTDAWQVPVPNTRYALKLYHDEDTGLWEITIVSTGWRHWVDMLIYLAPSEASNKVNHFCALACITQLQGQAR